MEMTEVSTTFFKAKYLFPLKYYIYYSWREFSIWNKYSYIIDLAILECFPYDKRFMIDWHFEKSAKF